MDQYAANKSKRRPLNVHESRRNLSNEEAGGHQLEDCCMSALPPTTISNELKRGTPPNTGGRGRKSGQSSLSGKTGELPEAS